MQNDSKEYWGERMSYFHHIIAKYSNKPECCNEKMKIWCNDRIGEPEVTWICIHCDNEIHSNVVEEREEC